MNGVNSTIALPIKIPSTATVIRNGESHLAAWALTPGVVLSVGSGQLTIAMGEALVAECRSALGKFPTIELFLGWEDVTA